MKTTFINTMLALLLLALPALLTAQDAPAEEEELVGWEKGAGIGLDFTQLLQINPKQGAGQNRLGFGTAVNFFANYKEGRKLWESTVLWQFGLQRLGSGVIAQGAAEKIPFQKSIDELRLNSKYGIQIQEGGKLYYAVNATFLSQLMPTYQYAGDDASYPGNFISDWRDTGIDPLSKLFAPATITLSVGLDWKPNDKFSLFYSPLGGKFIIVSDDVIASRGVHGNDVSGEPNADGIYPEFKKLEAQLGSLAQLGYKSNFAAERGNFTSSLNLYSNYLENPKNVDVDWANSLSYKLFSNFQLTALVNVFYDDDVFVQITDYDFPNGVSGLGKRVSVTQQLLLTYARTF